MDQKIKEPICKDIVQRTRKRLCVQCQAMIEPVIYTQKKILGLLLRTYPSCPGCNMDLSDDSLEVDSLISHVFSIYYTSFQLKDTRTCLTNALLLRELEGMIPEDVGFKQELHKWKKWAIKTIAENIDAAPELMKKNFEELCEKLSTQPDEKLKCLVKSVFRNIDIKLEMLGFFCGEEGIYEEELKFNQILKDAILKKKDISQPPSTFPAVEIYRYEQIFSSGTLESFSDMEEDEDGEDEDDEDELFENVDSLKPNEVRKFIPLDVDEDHLFFAPRTTTVEREGESELSKTTWYALLVLDNAKKIAYLYRTEGFVPFKEIQSSFETKSTLDSILITQKESDKDATDSFSSEFLSTLPANDMSYMAWKLDKAHIATYLFHDIIFKPHSNRELLEQINDGKGEASPEMDMIRTVLNFEGEKVEIYKRTAICNKCAGITRPFLRHKWKCPGCGAQDSASTYYCSKCESEINAGQHICNNCKEFLR